ncbi:transposase, partial [Limosilactobacillus fermentum]
MYNFHYHLIWVTKYRNPTFTSEALVLSLIH